MSTSSTELDIVHRPEIGRFETHVEGLRCEVDYQRQGQLVQFTHTGVPRQLEGRGIAAELVKAALSWARAEGCKVQALCSYVQAYIARHKEWQDLIS